MHPGNKVRMMIRMIRTNPMTADVVVTLLVASLVMLEIGRICPSVCPSDWDKRETPFVSTFVKDTYERRFQNKRRGRDSNVVA